MLRSMTTGGECGHADGATLKMKWRLNNAPSARSFVRNANDLRKSVMRACGALAN
jgi:hypothetical protein